MLSCSQIHVLQIHLLQVHVLQIHLLQVHVLQIQSSQYFTICLIYAACMQTLVYFAFDDICKFKESDFSYISVLWR